MDENNIIICSSCYHENVFGAKTCCKCGAKIYYNDEKELKESPKDEKEEVCTMDTEKNNSTNDMRKKNKMAELLSNLGAIIAIIGFLAGVILIMYGLIIFGAITIVFSILSMIFLLSFSEIIQLLQEIRDK